jgi:hypothetical protein
MARGIEESKDAVYAMAAVCKVLLKHFKDGADFDDIVGILKDTIMDEDFKATLEKAFEGASLIDDEIKDLNIAESVELGMLAFGQIRGIFK